MTPFVNAERLSSWIGVCPGNNESAGKRKHGHIRKGKYYLRRILCECASAGGKTKGTTFQSKFRDVSEKSINRPILPQNGSSDFCPPEEQAVLHRPTN